MLFCFFPCLLPSFFLFFTSSSFVRLSCTCYIIQFGWRMRSHGKTMRAICSSLLLLLLPSVLLTLLIPFTFLLLLVLLFRLSDFPTHLLYR